MKSRALLLTLLLLFIAPAVSFPCSNMGPNTHAGKIVALDAKEGTLTLIDAESGKPILFSAAPKLLASLRPSDRVVVRFTTEKERLIAEEIQS